MTEEVKRKRGRPPKLQSDDPVAIAKKMEEENDKFATKCAENMLPILNVIYNTALSTDKKTSPTNKISCAKYLIEYTSKYAEKVLIDEKASKQETATEEEDAKDKEPKAAAPLILLHAAE